MGPSAACDVGIDTACLGENDVASGTGMSQVGTSLANLTLRRMHLRGAATARSQCGKTLCQEYTCILRKNRPLGHPGDLSRQCHT